MACNRAHKNAVHIKSLIRQVINEHYKNDGAKYWFWQYGASIRYLPDYNNFLSTRYKKVLNQR